ncbi:hypothetical protein [Naasia sp. SYSU D00057]|uniref:hypothetical protein n=1 Tax=Naasia sp. SYSU D00057 TaxID=2817380 RepID=UPI001B302502|nr:hypothetical protein [Naasia sp. SYSU D00057]
MLNPAERLRQAIQWRVNVALDPVHHEIRVLHEEVDRLRRDVDRLTPQVASLETRLADLREAPTGAAAEVLDVQREHERVRLRMQAVSHYEERLRRLEERLGDGGAPVEGRS